MTDQPKHKGLYSALAAAQAEMGRALKDSNNPHFKSKYADLASVMDACMPALTKHGIAVLQPAHDEGGERFIKTIFVHGESGETAECRVPLIVSKNDMQGYGSASTYARRYGLMGMAGIAPDDDDGNAAAKSPPPRQDPPKPTPQQPDEAEIAQNIIADVDAARGDKAELTRLWGNYKSVMAGMSDVNFDAVKKAFEAAGTAAKHEPDAYAATSGAQDDLAADEVPF